MKKKVLMLILLAGFSGVYAYNFSRNYTECVLIKVPFFMWSDYGRREKILEALQNIEKYSIEDYARICTRISFIRITSFENQLVRLVPPKSFGSYASNNDDLSLKGVVDIDRDATDGHMDGLERILIHEACHAYLVQTSRDFSESPCEIRAQEYIKSKPEIPLEQRKAEFLKQVGKKYYAYCSARSEDKNAIKGDCVFINYTTESKNMCAKVFLKNGDKIELEKEVCRDINTMDYGNPSFELKYPVGKDDNVKYRFGFSPLNLE